MKNVLVALLAISIGPGILQAAGNSSFKVTEREGTDLIFVSLPFGSGPSHSRITQVIQDPIGFLWIGTKDGLKRYDGYRFRDFRPNPRDPRTVRGVFVHALLTDRSGQIWVASDDHLDRYDTSLDTFTHVNAKPGGFAPPVRDIYQDGDGTIWISTDSGLTRVDRTTGDQTTFQHDPANPAGLESNFVRASFEARDGAFWVATDIGLDVFDRQHGAVIEHYSLARPGQPVVTASENPVVRIFQDRAGVVWVASGKDGIARVDRQNQRLEFLSMEGDGGSTKIPEADAIYEDGDGSLWVGTRRDGLLRLDRNRTTCVRYMNHTGDPESLSSNEVLSLSRDREGNIWVGTGGGGLMRIPAQPLPFQRYQHEPGNPDSLSADYVSSVFEDSHGNLWVGTSGEVTTIDRKLGRYTHLRVPGIGQETDVTAIAEDREGRLWFGTRGGGLIRLEPGAGNWKTYRHDPANPGSLSDNTVLALLVDHTGRIWAGTDDGLNLFDAGTGRARVYRAPGLISNRVRALAEDTAGVLWLGTSFSGLQRFVPETGRFTVYRSSNSSGALSNDAVAAILVDRSGLVWAGTENGLNCLDPATGSFTSYYARDGLPNNNINGMVEDAAGDIWMTTGIGISHFDRRANVFRDYYHNDGVLGDFTTAWRSPGGELFFGANTGLTTLLPANTARPVFIPPVVFTDFQIKDKHVENGDSSVIRQAIYATRSITLTNAQNSFSFEFAALSYSNPQRTRYRYRLETQEKDWNEVDSAQRFARYTTVPAGDYVFRVQSRTSQSGWTEAGAEIRIRVLPPWWATWTFRAACVLAVLLIAWSIHQMRVRQIAREFSAHLEGRVDERLRVARELHDTLLQSFQGVLMKFQSVTYMLPDRPAEARGKLEAVIEQARQAVMEGRDAVQGLRSSTVLTNDLAQAIRTLADELAIERGGAGTPEFRLQVEGATRDLAPLVRDDVRRLGHEAVRNAFYHAQARGIDVEIHYEKSEFRLRVRDDGKGIDPTVLAAGGRAGHHGLPGMQERAHLVGGKLAVRSGPGSGTEIELTIPASIAYTRSPPAHGSMSSENRAG